MVIQTPTLEISAGSGADASSFVTGVVSPTPGSLLVLFVDNGAAVSGENDIPTITDTIGLTWTQRETNVGFDGTWLRGTFFTAPAPTGDVGTVTISFANTQSSCHWHVVEVIGANNDSPIVQAESSIFNTTVNPSFNLPVAPASSSLVLAAAIRNSTTPFTAGANHTILSSVAGSSNPAVGSDISYDMAPASQTVGFTTASGAQKTLFALEIAMGGTPPPPPSPPAEAVLVRKFEAVNTLTTNTFPITVPADLEVGETLVLSLNRVTGATTFAISSITGIGTNVWSNAAEAIRSATHYTNTIVIPITQLIPSGTVITVNYAGGTPTRKAVVASVWSGLTGEVDATSGVAGTNANGSTTAVSVSTTGPTTEAKTLLITTIAAGNVTYTPGASDTLVDTIATTAGSTERGVLQQYRVEESIGVKTGSGTISSGSWAASVVALVLEAAAAGTPIANAGGDQTNVEPGEPIDLSAEGSTADGAMTFVWEQIAGEIVNYTTSGPDLHIDEAPWTVAGTTLTFRVYVTSAGLTSTDEVSVTVLPSPDRIKVNGVEVALKIVPV